MENKKALVILGGMGPSASGYLYKLLIDLAIEKYGASNNEDFPEIILYSIPVPDFISDKKNISKALTMLRQKMVHFDCSNASCISIACNTAHILLKRLQKNSRVPFISMIEETSRQVRKNALKRIGLLATPSTLKYKLYEKPLYKSGIETVIPSQKQIVILEKIIRNILKGKILPQDTKLLNSIANGLKDKGAQGIILGCTELPLAFPKKYSLPIFNCLEILAFSLLQKYYNHDN